MKDKISLLIPTMNRPESLKRTLLSYCNGKMLPDQIIIVDQSQEKAISEDIHHMVDEIGNTYLVDTVYYYQDTPSSTQARNNALAFARNDIIVYSDDDVDVYENTLSNVSKLMEDPSVSMIAGIDDNAGSSNSKIGYLIGTKSYRKRKIGHVTLSVLGRYPKNIQGMVQTEWAMGFFFVVRKKYLDEWEIKWDENLRSYAYAEDLDFTYRYYKKSKINNLKCILCDSIRVKHLVSKEYRIPSRKDIYMYVKNRAYLSYKLKLGLKSAICMRWTNFWILMRRVVKNEKPSEMFSAIIETEKEKKLIKSGILKY